MKNTKLSWTTKVAGGMAAKGHWEVWKCERHKLTLLELSQQCITQGLPFTGAWLLAYAQLLLFGTLAR